MSAAVQVTLGMLLVVLVFTAVVTGLQEWWAQLRALRGNFLRYGLMRLLDDDAIYVRVLQHPLVNGVYRSRAARGKPPSYLDPTSFSMALVSVVLERAAAADKDIDAQPSHIAPSIAALSEPTLTPTALRVALASLAAQRSSVALALLPIVDRSNGNLEAMLCGIEDWFDASMQRVGGWYLSHTQKTLFFIGFLVAGLGNVDSLAIFQSLNAPAAVQQDFVADAATVPGDELD